MFDINNLVHHGTVMCTAPEPEQDNNNTAADTDTGTNTDIDTHTDTLALTLTLTQNLRDICQCGLVYFLVNLDLTMSWVPVTFDLGTSLPVSSCLVLQLSSSARCACL